MNHILVIEDQEDVRELIAYNLKKQNYEVIEAANANDALILLEDVSLDLVLLDLMLPGLSGLDFLKILKAKDEYRQLAVIILSAKTEEQEVVTGLKLGADDYVTKPFSIKVLLAKIESVLRRVSQREEDVLTYQDIRLHQDEHKVFSGKEEVILTNKEFELLLLFLKKPKKIFHRYQLLNSIWGYDSETYTRTVDAHVSSLRKKLGPMGKLIRSVPKVGYGLDV
ncbi:MAG: DNA-binding response regulator [Candidatus Lambdaproteobacteria bacterium RIFOXYD12_FULL_49_8]|uniref:DNA-binding response regulator n=1 Tax=Candidatus Lambdaproteobacteria bacterium RIFOXYD2_FULL_50_16 TaxID=1817772 RepID=A0A1F6GFP2_9PROT|nr:MAG: DNA-binding response regulator [Candidatus Lambdaproteobacteria bacterium RIFOXYD2_FULL_50_16]OGG97884.1 MAG: DNA-binding response regulator [Candidatus Lambdaproteobacteria bacterium RIFOXYD12_FULL_49_8]